MATTSKGIKESVENDSSPLREKSDVDPPRLAFQHGDKDGAKKQAAIVSTGVEEELDILLKMIPAPVREKVTFTGGILVSLFTAVVLHGYPPALPWMYSLLFTLLMPIRFWMYRRVKWHYFMLDFCYFANLALLLFLWVFPSEPRLFLMVFADANGPLAWAIPAWRNALVFHDLDKMTSLYIHIFPMIVTYILRWNRHDLSFYWDRWAVCICPENSTQEDAVRVPSYLQWNATPELENATVPWLGTFNQNNYCGGSAFSPEDCALDPAFTFTWIVAFPVIGYLFWQFLYYVIVQCCRRKKIERDGGYLTSYIHLSKSKKHPVGKILRRFGKKTRVFMFGVLQLVYTIATFMLCSLFYHYHAAHIAFIAFVVASSAWNGASFYVVVFPKKMMDHKGKDKEVQQNSSSEDASGGKKNKIVPCSEGKK